MKKVKMVTMQKDPKYPDSPTDRLKIVFDDDTSMTHVFGNYYKDKEAWEFMNTVYKCIPLGAEVGN